VALGNLAQRALVAIVAVPVLIGILYFPSRPEPTWLLILAATMLAMREFFAMTMPGDDNASDRTVSLAIGLVACSMLYWISPVNISSSKMQGIASNGPLISIVFTVLATGLYYLFRFRDMSTVAMRFGYTIAGIVYCGFTFSFLALMRRDAGKPGADIIILILGLAWVADTGAYFAGRFFGNSKLYPAVSPKKTWAGAVGGLAGSLLAAVLMKLFRMEYLTWLDVILIAVPGGMLGQMGDLAESMIKRSVGVKDSGALLPGHGGMLDRIDAVLFIAPYVYCYFLIAPLLH
jgi:phosphatidate cytidylyltransferase